MLKQLLVLTCLISATLCSAADLPRYSAGSETPQARILQQLGGSHELLDMRLDNSRFSLLYRPAMTPQPHGTLLILPDPTTAEGWLTQVQALVEYLPEHGWNILVVEPPTAPTEPVPARLPAVSSPSETATSAPAVDTNPQSVAPTFDQQVQQRLDLAWSELQQRASGKQRIIVGIGAGAAWSTAFAIAGADTNTVVMINPRPISQAPSSLVALIPALTSHQVIDLYHHPLPGYPEAEPDAKQRRLLAARLGLSRYHQSRLPGIFRGWQADMPWFARHVRGLLERTLLDAEPNPESEPETTLDAAPAQAPPGQHRPQPARGSGAA